MWLPISLFGGWVYKSLNDDIKELKEMFYNVSREADTNRAEINRVNIDVATIKNTVEYTREVLGRLENKIDSVSDKLDKKADK